MGIEDMDMSVVGNWNLDGRKETNRESLDIELAVEEEVEPLEVEDELRELAKIHASLTKKYENHPKKGLYDTLVSLTLTVQALEKVVEN